MNVYYEDEFVTLHHGDCLDVLQTLPAASVDSVVTDPPYGLEFMGRDWDGADGFRRSLNANDVGRDNAFGRTSRTSPEHRTDSAFQRWCELWATECLRVLKPGGHLLAFGGTRTWHRLSCAIEDAGFEVRDSIAWLYGSGFPKSRNLDGDWAGWGTALKPAFEPIVVARKPLAGTVAANVLTHSTGALNIDGCRVSMSAADADFIRKTARPNSAGQQHVGDVMNRPSAPTVNVHDAGRWPANVLLDESQAEALDAQGGNHSGSGVYMGDDSRNPGQHSTDFGGAHRPASMYSDDGGASRFFPTFRYEAKAPSSERPRVNGTAHPTVKPLDLMRWLVRLVTPPGGTVLEPFAGSGTTAEACIIEGFKCIAIEREADYLPLILARITKPIEPVLDFGQPA